MPIPNEPSSEPALSFPDWILEYTVAPDFPLFSWVIEGGLPETIATNSWFDDKNQYLRELIDQQLGENHDFSTRIIGSIANMLIRPTRSLPYPLARTIEPVKGRGVTFHAPDALFLGHDPVQTKWARALKSIFEKLTDTENSI